MPPKRRRVRLGIALCVILAILTLFVLDGPLAGVTALATMLLFIATCIQALRSEDPESVTHNERTGLAGWVGGWF
jgi:hypothetical protein